MLDELNNLPNTEIVFLCEINNHRIYLKKDYLNDTEIQGNKLRKLKYNLLHAKQNHRSIISFGGAYSNHISALAAACYRYKIPCMGIIRGEELANPEKWNKTLLTAHRQGMKLFFVSRNAYQKKQESAEVLDKIKQFNHSQDQLALLVPEGGTNQLAIKGCEEVIQEVSQYLKNCNLTPYFFSQLFCACGTAGTLSGLINGAFKFQLKGCKIFGVSALKGINHYLQDQVFKWADTLAIEQLNWQIIDNVTNTKYGQINNTVTHFIESFYRDYHIELDKIYTAKLVMTVFERAMKQINTNPQNWLIYHSGGLQSSAKMKMY